MTFPPLSKNIRIYPRLFFTMILLSMTGQAQSMSPTAVPQSQTLRHFFDRAWERQPEALALKTRREAVQALLNAAQAWTPEPSALDIGYKTDRVARNQGAREIEIGVSVPLWLPGEQRRRLALAEAEVAATESRTFAAQLRVAGTVRDAWWQWQRSRVEAEIARGQLELNRQLAADVVSRIKVGDLARSDQHQADGAVASAEAILAQAEASLAAAQQQLHSLAGAIAFSEIDFGLISEPIPSSLTIDIEDHAQLLELKGKVAVTQRIAALTAIQNRASPELALALTQDRGAFGERFQRSLSVGVRIPFGGGPRHEARVAMATAEATEAQAQLDIERERLNSERGAARVRVEAARTQLAAAERRVVLARESRGFFERSFRLGETDLPTRLRIEAEAADAERQAARSQVELSSAVSSLRQALGLLPQ
jgi:cobalt-zinc-cadmium efflux system outer membrane protein